MKRRTEVVKSETAARTGLGGPGNSGDAELGVWVEVRLGFGFGEEGGEVLFGCRGCDRFGEVRIVVNGWEVVHLESCSGG